MAGALGRRLRGYNGCVPARLWRGLAAVAALTLALASGGCSISYQLDTFFGGDKSDTTASIAPAPGAKPITKLPPDGDLAYARAAASEVLKRGKKDASLSWENPKSGARGTVTPIARAYTQDGHTCRNFLASFVNGSDQAWLQGEACRLREGAWEVRTLKPWKQS